MKDVFVCRSWRVVLSLAVGLGVLVALKLSVSSAQMADAPSMPAEMQRSSTLISGSRVYTIHLPLAIRWMNTRVLPAGIQFYGALNMGNGLDHAADAGARWIRVPLSWAAIEPVNTTPASYDWSSLDLSVTNATDRDVQLILTIAGQPSWAATYAMGPVTDTADLIEFVGALVERYDGDGLNDAPGSPRVRYFELYNEPDNADVGHAMHGGWGYWGHDGAGYGELLCALHPVVKAANPQANLVLGGLALDNYEPTGPFDPNFLDDVLAACQGRDCFDVMNYHYYPPFRSQWKLYGIGIIGKANYIRQKLSAYGFADKPIVCTETSWVSGADWGSDELQSRYVVKAYTRGMAAGLDAIVWYRISDGGDSSLPGLLNDYMQAKPSYSAFQIMTGMLDGAVYHRSLTQAETGSAQIEGYVFKIQGRQLDVVWTEDDTPYDPDDDPWLPLSVQADTLRAVDKFGNEIWYDDEGDGKIDGRITVLVNGSPLYLEHDP